MLHRARSLKSSLFVQEVGTGWLTLNLEAATASSHGRSSLAIESAGKGLQVGLRRARSDSGRR